MPGTRITLITRDVETPYSGMLPGYLAGHYSRAETHIDLGALSRFAGARLIHAATPPRRPGTDRRGLRRPVKALS